MAGHFAGIDIGSTITKVALIGDGAGTTVIGPTGPEQRRLANKVMEKALKKAGLAFESISYVVATGYGRLNVPFADKQVTEITCHAKGVAGVFPRVRTIIDIGGQDCKGIKVDQGRPVDFVMNDKCAAGTGRFLEVIADSLGVTLEEMSEKCLQAESPAKISNICTVWAEQEVRARLSEGICLEDLVSGIIESLANRISRMIKRLRVEDQVVMTGGGAKIPALVRAFMDKLGRSILVPEEPLMTGALGAAFLGREIVQKAVEEGREIERKERSLEEVEILGF